VTQTSTYTSMLSLSDTAQVGPLLVRATIADGRLNEPVDQRRSRCCTHR
jgi:hypothetical protein